MLTACNKTAESGSETDAYVNEQSCISCHAQQYREWKESHHDLAMQEAADTTVLGDFNNSIYSHYGDTSRFFISNNSYFVYTKGADGQYRDYKIKYTFGVDPLQQYLVEMPGGRLQAFTIAWDVQKKRWFSLFPNEQTTPDNALHWTGSYHTWNSMCAECHSTNLQANYDPFTDSYQTTWDKIDVGCQACHGPGSRHLEIMEGGGNAKQNGSTGLRDINSTPERQILNCAPCHSRRSRLTVNNSPDGDYYESFMPELLREGLYFSDGQIQDEVFVLGSFLQSKMYQRGVKCTDCHNPHSNQLLATGNALCNTCHSAQPNPRFADMPSQKYDSPEHHFHTAGSPGAQCINCHMLERNYMVIDPRRDHSFRIPRPDLTVKLGTPNSCNSCHQDKTPEWAVDAIEKWYGNDPSSKPHYAQVFALGRSGSPAAKEPLASLLSDTGEAAIVRSTAMELLSRYNDESLSEKIKTAIHSPEPILRLSGARALESIAPTARVALATPLLSDSLPGVRQAAARSLAGLPEGVLRTEDVTRYRDALAEHKNVLLASSDQAGGSFNLALFYERLSIPDSAIYFYQRALEKDALLLPAFLNLATLYNRIKNNEQAENVLMKGIEELPKEGQLYYSLGLLLAEQKRLKDAVQYLQQAAALLPDNARVHYNTGLAFQHLGRNEEAERMLMKACALNSNESEFAFALTVFFIQTKQLAKAKIEAESFLKRFPGNPQIKTLLRQIQAVTQKRPES